MSDVASAQPDEQLPPQGSARVVYLGPVAPHWEIHRIYGDERVIDAFRQRTMARLLVLPPHDPQFRRNRERVIRDAERERLILEWDLGLPGEEELLGAPAEAVGPAAGAVTPEASAPADPA